jgi:hypothetical protein
MRNTLKLLFFLIFFGVFLIIPISAQSYQNFTAYTEVDIPANRITVVNDTRADLTALDLDETVYLYYDYGVNYFENFTLEIDIRTSSIGFQNPRAYACGVGNNTGDISGDSDTLGIRMRRTTTTKWQISLYTKEGGVPTVQTYEYNNYTAFWIFPRLKKEGTNVTLWVFKDRNRTIRYYKATQILANSDRYRYSYAFRSDNIAIGGRAFDFDIYRYFITSQDVNAYPPNLLYGAGFNDSDPYIDIRWNHSKVYNEQFEIYHSANGINFTSLDITSDLNYTHRGLINGSYHYYKVRSIRTVNGNWVNSSFTPVNRERVYYIVGGGTFRAVLSYVYYPVSSFNNITGVVSGNLSDIRFPNDGLIMNLTEIVGSPAFDIRFNWTGLPDNLTALNLFMRAYYTGNLAHNVTIEVWNFTGGYFQILRQLPSGGGFQFFNMSLSALRNSYLNNGSVWVRIIHYSAGNINHLMEFDYVSLRGIIPIVGNGGNELLGAWDINWLTTVIWLGVLGFGIFNRIGVVKIFAGLFGIILGLLMLAVNSMVAIALICVNIYFIYEGTESR